MQKDNLVHHKLKDLSKWLGFRFLQISATIRMIKNGINKNCTGYN